MSTKIYDSKMVVTRYCMGKGKVGYNFRIDGPFISLDTTLTTDETKELIQTLQNSINDMG